jgi:NTE family protein
MTSSSSVSDSRKADGPLPGSPRIGLALGGGAAHGFAHIPVLEALDEAGIRPTLIAGTSMGAILGALYASGMSGAAIREHTLGLFRSHSEFLARLWQLRPRRLREVAFGFGQYDLERVLAAFLPAGVAEDFAELRIPLRAVATDYHAGRAVVLAEGRLLPAIAASAALPVLFKPVRIGGRVMVDGGITNPVPFDALDGVDLVIAVDVVNAPMDNSERMPGSLEALFGATAVAMRALVREKLGSGRPPDMFIRPPPPIGINVFDFARAARIIRGSEPVKAEVTEKLGRLLGDASLGHKQAMSLEELKGLGWEGDLDQMRQDRLTPRS